MARWQPLPHVKIPRAGVQEKAWGTEAERVASLRPCRPAHLLLLLSALPRPCPCPGLQKEQLSKLGASKGRATTGSGTGGQRSLLGAPGAAQGGKGFRGGATEENPVGDVLAQVGGGGPAPW